MSNGLIALLLAAGVGGWVYNFMMKQTGSQAKPSLTFAGIVAVIVFLIIFVVAGMIN